MTTVLTLQTILDHWIRTTIIDSKDSNNRNTYIRSDHMSRYFRLKQVSVRTASMKQREMLWNQVNYIFILKNHVWPNFKLSSEKYHQHGPLHCKNLGIKKTTLTHWPQPTPYKSFPGTRGAQPSRNAALQKFCGPHLTAMRPIPVAQSHYILSLTSDHTVDKVQID